MKKLISGFSLIEVLISLLILSVILLGFDTMQVKALRENENAYLFTVAENQLNSMAERLYANGVLSGAVIARWNEQNKLLLPHGKGSITGSYPNYTIALFWGEKSTLSLGVAL